jgi:hypothetical protein
MTVREIIEERDAARHRLGPAPKLREGFSAKKVRAYLDESRAIATDAARKIQALAAAGDAEAIAYLGEKP